MDERNLKAPEVDNIGLLSAPQKKRDATGQTANSAQSKFIGIAQFPYGEQED